MEDAARVLTGNVEPAAQPFLRPLSALTILAIDWWLFGGVAVTFGLGLLFELTIGALLAAAFVAMLQMRSGDRKWYWKALLAAFIVGVPTPVAGTSYALVVLGLAGIKEAMDVIRGVQTPQTPPR
ncbi:MAG TPA: hypothetical protein VFB63_25515 [Bryobacteraceae bacterium]|jgi:hypothetical protein|nr:hypothetical protein [Bryobacteraceae bacterium]